MIFTKKKFDLVNPHLPKAKAVRVEYTLFEVAEDMSYSYILETLALNGYRGASYPELLGFEEDWDGEAVIIAPGSQVVFEGEEYCPCFSMKYSCTPEGCRAERKLGMINTKWPWLAPFKILAVKLSPA